MRFAERLNHLQALQSLVLSLLRGLGVGLVPEFVRQFVELDAGEQHVESLGAHLGDELVRVVVVEILIVFGQSVQNVEILFFGQEVQRLDAVGRLDTRLHNDIAFIIYDRIEFLGRQAEQITDLVGQRLEIPDVSHRHHKRYVAHAFAAHLFLGHFHTATVADDAAIANALVFSTMTFVILDRAEYSLAEQTIPLWLVSPIVDGLRFKHLAARHFKYFLRRS